jgi:hypothetical protein
MIADEVGGYHGRAELGLQAGGRPVDVSACMMCDGVSGAREGHSEPAIDARGGYPLPSHPPALYITHGTLHSHHHPTALSTPITIPPAAAVKS